MFDHVTIRVSDRAASGSFYERVLATLEIEQTHADDVYVEWDDFGLKQSDGGLTRGLHVGFVAPSREHVDAFWHAGVDAGYRDDGAPGPRPQYRPEYYGAFLLDPDGNSAEAVHHDVLRRDGAVDHVWIRVADVEAAQRFYAAVAPHAGFAFRGWHDDARSGAWFTGGNGSFSVVAGPPTQDLHLAFPAADDAAVDAFHADLVAQGYRDAGPPGERAVYHPGYYGAFVLDPDGNNVELVHHGRPG